MNEALRKAYEAEHPQLARRLNFDIPAPDVGFHNFAFCKMGDEGMRYVHDILEHPERVENLVLSGNELTDASVPLIADIIRRAPKMTDLSISRNALTEKGFSELAEVVGEHPQLEVFRSADNALQGEALAKKFCERLDDEARHQKGAKGSAFLISAFEDMPPESIVQSFHGQGISLGAKELLNDEGKAAPLLKMLSAKEGGVEALFTAGNWKGNQGEMQRVYTALPDDQKPSNYHALVQQLRATRNAGLGR